MSYTDISVTPPQWRHNHSARLRPINWNNITDEKDREIWNRLTSNFWLPEKVPLSNDLPSWNQLSDMERSVTMRVFTGLTMLDTVQATVGEISQIQDGITEHEQAIYANIAFMQAVHARSYSSIFSTLSNTPEIDAAYTWAVNNDLLQERAKMVLQHYYGEDSLKRKVASTLLSSLLLYAGFYLPLYFSARGILMNTADMIRLILRDKAVHGYYSGYKYQRGLDLHPERVAEMEDFTFQLLDDLYELELKYSGEIYEPTGLMDDVAVFVRYNANKAMMNLGYPTRFAPEETEVKADILAALAPGSEETHDFFSGSGSSYVIGSAESTSDEDWDF
ncbi:ribonucleoside-diphosphate reductase, beta subunit [Mobiluncus mulieris 28-1]|uniref:class 1b ribonucleoside-diphosphate reductase subunit beta n=1 Tax=Mobiluncus mulieris TaxID=2052 RepID=UPI0001BE7DBE|nr:class 1b ribonucleoside-diphosphate reductase subunit beta [Mobiluncus mulieris]EEZ91342.1 ribonucleoside-diphosphate reductase, beta subunit [Mobiluncus mulieris 28-1]STY84126.1 Ribonucleoside-diphosphate reductase subunit beta nrdF2 [Mobiluncus mulieris]